MSVSAGVAYVDLTAGDTTKLKGDVEKAGAEASEGFGGKFREGFGEQVKGIAEPLVAMFAVGAVGEFLAQGVEGAEKMEQTNSVLEAKIAATGGAANVSKEQIDSLSESLSSKTAVDQQQIMSSESLLLGFTNVKNAAGANNDIFNQASKAALDLSAATGKGLTPVTMALGKALQDPAKGLTALTRMGITFTAQQQAQIKVLEKSGDTLGAQKIILQGVEDRYAGVAEAAATPMAKMQNDLAILGRTLGAMILPALSEVAGAMAGFAQWLTDALSPASALGGVVGQDLTAALAAFKQGAEFAFGALQNAVQIVFPIVSGAVSKIMPVIMEFASWLGSKIPPLVEFLGSIFQLVMPIVAAIVQDAVSKIIAVWHLLEPGLKVVVDFIQSNVLPIFKSFAQFLADHKQDIVAIADAIGVYFVGKLVIAAVQSAIQFGIMIAGWVAHGIAAAVNAAVVVGSWIAMGASAIASAALMAAAWIAAFWPVALVIAAVIAVAALIILNWNTIKDTTVKIFQGLVDYFTLSFNNVKNIFQTVLNFLTNLWNTVWNGIKTAFQTVLSWIVIYVQVNLLLIQTFIVNPIMFVVNWIGGALNGIGNAFRSVFGGIGDFVSSVFSGLVGIIKEPINAIIGLVNNVIGAIDGISVDTPLGHIGFSIPKIPSLAKGGIIQPTPGGTLVRVAEAGQPEAVVPLGQSGQFGGGGGNTINIYTVPEPSADSLAHTIDNVLTHTARAR